MKVKLPCPNCQRPTPPKELEAFKGVCKFCRRSFVASNAHWIEGGRLREAKPVRVEGSFENGEMVKTTDFDFEQVAELLGEIRQTPQEARQIAAEAFGRIMAWVWGGHSLSIRKAAIRFTTLTAALKPELVGNLSYTEIGRQFQLTKAAISKTAKLFERAFNFKASRGRSDEQCALFSRVQLGHPPTHSKKKATARRKSGDINTHNANH